MHLKTRSDDGIVDPYSLSGEETKNRDRKDLKNADIEMLMFIR